MVVVVVVVVEGMWMWMCGGAMGIRHHNQRLQWRRPITYLLLLAMVEARHL
jgi:hypothetical protein